MSGEQQYGYGSIYQRASDNRWIASVEEERHRGLPRKRITFSAKDRGTVELKLAAYRAANPVQSRPGRAAYLIAARELGTHTAVEWWNLVRACGGACHYCGEVDAAFEMDHKIPVSRGGSDAIDNLTVACIACNREKHDMTDVEYLAFRAARQ